MLFEEIDDLCQVLHPTNPQFHSIAVIHNDRSAAKIRLHFLEDSFISSVLYDPELGQDLPARLHSRLAVDTDVEATFAIDEPDDPLRIQPFLLITCTHALSLSPSHLLPFLGS